VKLYCPGAYVHFASFYDVRACSLSAFVSSLFYTIVVGIKIEKIVRPAPTMMAKIETAFMKIFFILYYYKN